MVPYSKLLIEERALVEKENIKIPSNKIHFAKYFIRYKVINKLQLGPYFKENRPGTEFKTDI